MSWDKKNCTINRGYGIIEFIDKIIERFNVILKLGIKIDLFHNSIYTCMCWIPL